MTTQRLITPVACSSAVTCPASQLLLHPHCSVLPLTPPLRFFFCLFVCFCRSRGGADRPSGHTERRRGGEADDRGAGERDEGSLHQRHLFHARRSARQAGGWHPGGLALQVPIQEEEEVQATVLPEEEQEAEGEGGDLRGAQRAPPPPAPRWNCYCETFPGVRRPTDSRSAPTLSDMYSTVTLVLIPNRFHMLFDPGGIQRDDDQDALPLCSQHPPTFPVSLASCFVLHAVTHVLFDHPGDWRAPLQSVSQHFYITVSVGHTQNISFT